MTQQEAIEFETTYAARFAAFHGKTEKPNEKPFSYKKIHALSPVKPDDVLALILARPGINIHQLGAALDCTMGVVHSRISVLRERKINIVCDKAHRARGGYRVEA